jgi:hypothetical protein
MIGCQTLSICVAFGGRVGGHAQGLLEHNDCFHWEVTLIFGLWWPRTAFQRCITSSHPPYAWTLLEASSAP